MQKNRKLLDSAIEKGEEKNGSIEFKEQLKEDIHLEDGKRESLAAQMRYRVKCGNGEATYVIGVSDDGDLNGLKQEKFSETIDVLSLLSAEVDVYINDVKTWNVKKDRIVGLVTIKDQEEVEKDHLIVGTAGHVDHGKSTLVGTLMTGKSDDGEGSSRSYLDVKPHEVERGLSADLSYAVYGFDENDSPIRMDDPNRNQDRSELVESSEKLVSFVDTVGHKPWLRTTIRGLVGQKIDYGLITIAADDGPTQTTKEHLGLLMATELPVIATITKTDLVSEERVNEVEIKVEKLLRQAGRSSITMDKYDTNEAVDEIQNGVVPIIRTSAVNMEGFDKLDDMLLKLPPTSKQDRDSKMYIDKIYNIDGVGPVVSGTVQSGSIERGDELLLGPTKDGSFIETSVRSIEIHYYDVEKAKEGQIASLAISNVDVDQLERGMVLLPINKDPEPTKEFIGEVMILNHPTSITSGYEPVIHLETISETAIIEPESGQLMPGQKGHAKFKFKFNSHYIEEGQKFVFREGDSKGVGKVTEIIE